MHEMHLASKIAQVIKKYQQENGLKKINRVVLELGDVEEHGQFIKAENLIFNIAMILGDEKIQIDIKKIDGAEWRLVEIDGEK